MSSPHQAMPSPEPQEDFRPRFTQFLNDPATLRSANGVTLWTVRGMNQRMVTEQIPMSRAHYEAASSSVGRGDGMCGFLSTENELVRDSSGRVSWGYTTTPVYAAGLNLHRLLGFGGGKKT